MLVIDGIIFSLQKFGGISTYFNELINRIPHQIDESELWVYSENPNLKNSEILTLKHKNRVLERYRDLKGVKENSICHSSYYRISKSKKVKNVISVYDFTYEKFAKFPSNYIHSFQKKRALYNADLILSISQSTKNDLLNLYKGIPEEKVIVTHLAASDDFKPLYKDNSARFQKPFVLFVGSRGLFKNFTSTVKAVAMLDELNLHFVGGGPISKEEGLILNDLLPGRYKHIVGAYSEKLNELYNQATCLVYPSLYEGFGIPVLEAMAANCPVIATNISSIPEVANQSAYLLENPDAENIYRGIIKMLDKQYNSEIAAKGLKNSLNFNWDITAKKTIEAYKNLF
jgi:mannosyltransferase